MNKKYIIALSVFIACTSWGMALPDQDAQALAAAKQLKIQSDMLKDMDFETRGLIYKTTYLSVYAGIQKDLNNTMNEKDPLNALVEKITNRVQSEQKQRNDSYLSSQVLQGYGHCYGALKLPVSQPDYEIAQCSWNNSLTQIAVVEKKDATTWLLSVWKEKPDIFQEPQSNLDRFKECTSIVNNGGLCKAWAKQPISELRRPVSCIRFINNDTKLLWLSRSEEEVLSYYNDAVNLLTGKVCDCSLEETLAALGEDFITTEVDSRLMNPAVGGSMSSKEKRIECLYSSIRIIRYAPLEDIAEYLIKNAQEVKQPNAYKPVVKKQKKNE